MGFYRSKDTTNSVKEPKDDRVLRSIQPGAPYCVTIIQHICSMKKKQKIQTHKHKSIYAQ